MEHPNQTIVTYFIIKGISDVPELQSPIFILVLLIYLTSLGGNMMIFMLVCLDSHLHTPMYFFLCNLSIMDVSYSSVTLQHILVSFILGDNRISLLGCMTQLFIFLSLACDELLILTAMSYDRHVAICNPLHYSTVMNGRVCVLLAIACWFLGILETIPHIYVISEFSCYRSNEVNHFFCDIVPIMKLTCSDTLVLELYMIMGTFFYVGLTPFLLTFISYSFIISTILRIRSSSGRLKAFYTCSSHITVLILLYGTLSYQYLIPVLINDLNPKKLLSLLNTAAVPVLNPLIYSLKNKDVKSALRRRLKSCNSTA